MKKVIKNLVLILVIISAMWGQPVLATDYDSNTYVYNHLESWDTEFRFDYDKNDVIDVIRNIAKQDDYLSLSLEKLVYDKNNGELYVTYKTTKEEEEYVNEELNKIIKSIITNNMSDYDKISTINKYLVDKVDYDSSLKSDTAYSTLTTGKATCEGYALTAYKMLKLAGIENKIVVGKINGVGHGWNLVKLSGKWYNLDITNNDATSSEKYFLVCDDVLKKDNFTWSSNDYPTSDESYYGLDTNLTSAKQQLSNEYKSNSNGKWEKNNNSWYFIKNTGTNATGWNLIDSKWYFLGNDGIMKTGWTYSNNKWYYCYPGSGYMAVSTIVDGYTVDSSGAWIS